MFQRLPHVSRLMGLSKTSVVLGLMLVSGTAFASTPVELSKEAFVVFYEGGLRGLSTSALVPYTDRAMSRNNINPEDVLKNFPTLDDDQNMAFKAFAKIERMPKEDIYRSDEFQTLINLSSSEEWKTAFFAEFLMGVLFLRRSDIGPGLESASRALERIPTNEDSRDVLNARFDIYDLMHLGLIMDGSGERSLEIIAKLLEHSRKTGRKVDPFTLVNNVAAMLLKRGDSEEALLVLRGTEQFLDSATTQQKIIYHYSLGRMLNANSFSSEAINSLDKALSMGPPPRLRAYILSEKARADKYSTSVRDLTELIEEITELKEDIDLNEELGRGLLGLKARRYELLGEYEEALNAYSVFYDKEIEVARAAQIASRQKVAEKLERSERIAAIKVQNAINETELRDQVIAAQQAVVKRNKWLLYLSLLITAGLLLFSAREKISSNKLKRSRDKAVRGEKAKTEFLQTMSHEFRTPLNAIIPLAELLKNRIKDPVYANMLSTIQSNGTSLLAMIDNILEITRGEEEPIFFEDWIEPGQLVRDVLEGYRPSLKPGVEFQYHECSPPLKDVYMIPHAFKGIVNNLISNAVKFTSKGEITVKLFPNPHDLTQILLEVSDTGVGMDEEKLGKYVKAFESADMGMTRKYGGAGLGLAVFMKHLNNLGGKADLSSKIGVGTKWTILLPNKIGVEEEKKTKQKSAA